MIKPYFIERGMYSYVSIKLRRFLFWSYIKCLIGGAHVLNAAKVWNSKFSALYKAMRISWLTWTLHRLTKTPSCSQILNILLLDFIYLLEFKKRKTLFKTLTQFQEDSDGLIWFCRGVLTPGFWLTYFLAAEDTFLGKPVGLKKTIKGLHENHHNW